MSQAFLLVNTNVLKPPVSPVGLEYVGQSLVDAGIPVEKELPPKADETEE